MHPSAVVRVVAVASLALVVCSQRTQEFYNPKVFQSVASIELFSWNGVRVLYWQERSVTAKSWQLAAR